MLNLRSSQTGSEDGAAEAAAEAEAVGHGAAEADGTAEADALAVAEAAALPPPAPPPPCCMSHGPQSNSLPQPSLSLPQTCAEPTLKSSHVCGLHADDVESEQATKKLNRIKRFTVQTPLTYC